MIKWMESNIYVLFTTSDKYEYKVYTAKKIFNTINNKGKFRSGINIEEFLWKCKQFIEKIAMYRELFHAYTVDVYLGESCRNIVTVQQNTHLIL